MGTRTGHRGEGFGFDGTTLLVDEPRRIVQTEHMTGTDFPSTTNDLSFYEEDGATLVTLLIAYPDAVHPRHRARHRHGRRHGAELRADGARRLGLKRDGCRGRGRASVVRAPTPGAPQVVGLVGRGGRAPGAGAATALAMRFSTSAVTSAIANDTGHMGPSSSWAVSSKLTVPYRVLNFDAGW